MNAQVQDHPVIELPIKVSGHVRIKVVRADGSIKDEREFENLVTDVGLDLMGTSDIKGITDYLAVGTGTNVPAVTDTGLQTELTRIGNPGSFTYDSSGASPWWSSAARTWAFNPGTFSGQSLTELGLFNTTFPGSMFSRALIKDAGGTPTAIVVLADEYLYVTWEIRRYVGNEGDVTGSINISGTSYDYTIRACNVDGHTSDLHTWSATSYSYARFMYAYETNIPVAIDAEPGGLGDGASSESLASYSNGNHYRDLTATWEPADGNFSTGIGAVGLIAGSSAPSYVGWVIYFSTDKIPKDSDNRFILTARVSWDRH